MFLKNIMYKTKLLSDYLQGESINIAGALVAINSTNHVLRRIRAGEAEINNEIEAAVAVAMNYGTEPLADFARLHRMRRPPRRFDDHPETASPLLNSITSYYRSEFYKFMDAVISTLDEKFQSLKDVFEPFLNVIDPDNDAKKLVATFPSVFSPDAAAAIHNEFKVFFEYFFRESDKSAENVSVQEAQNSSENNVPITKVASIALTTSRKHGLFKTVAKVYQLFLTAAPSVCKNERSFSSLKRVKNYLRSTMSGDRLNDSMLLAVERDLTDRIDLKKRAIKWSLLKDRGQKIAR